VAVALRVPHLLSYAVPAALAELLRPGMVVRVPYGARGRQVEGLCVRVSKRTWDHTLRPIAEIVSDRAVLSEKLVELGLWVSEYYVCPPGLVFAAMVPTAARRQRKRRVKILRLSGKALPEKLSQAQHRLLEVLATGELSQAEALRRAGVSAGVLARLRAQALVEIIERDQTPGPAPMPAEALATGREPVPEDEYVLTPSQDSALRQITQAAAPPGQFQVFLLYGVPGSGKTEVYVRAIRHVLAAGRQAIVLVPEIALATQVVDRLARRFDRVAVWHSRLPEGLRLRTWEAIVAGGIDVVIGTRSAVFAPCPQVGLIVVDEEQDDSFKSLALPYVNSRDVAIKRAQLEQIPVVLGSATPALETWHNAQNLAHYRVLRLPERVGGLALPIARAIAFGKSARGEVAGVLAPELVEAVAKTLSAGQQVILLHNRRGYAIYVRCQRCGLVVVCQRCGTRLVYHRADERLHCHRCGLRQGMPPACPDRTCRGKLIRVGQAIERLQEELSELFPKARIQRLDRDTMRRREDYAQALRRFESGEADILIGTEMVAKGLDFPRVRLVGVIDADAALAIPDFRAAERVFQLVMQVVGRAGRSEGQSLALVQCADPRTPAVAHAIRIDYEGFAGYELTWRRRFFYPPFSRLVRLVLADGRPNRARSEAERLAEGLRTLAGRIHPALQVSDAQPCLIARVRELRRYQVLVRGPRDRSLHRLLQEAAEQKLLSPRTRRFMVDVDPLDLL
jgi:primosomal protein N' (replication factor Y)